jgi:AcrR family transcriptional regulator
MPKLVDHNERRRELLQTTWAVLARMGFEGATMREIAREAGYSTGVLTHYFRNKDELLSAAIDLTVADAQKRRAEILGALRGYEALRAAAIDLVPHGEQSITRWAAWICYWGRGVADPEIANAHFKYSRDSRDGLVQLLEEALEQGEVRPEIDVIDEADKIMALVYGLAIHVLINKMERHRPLELLDEHLNSLRTGTSPKPTAYARLAHHIERLPS